MGYLINPKIFYFMNMIESVEAVVCFTLFFSAILLCVLAWFYVATKEEANGRYGDEESKKTCEFIESKFKPKLIMFVLTLMVVITIIIPSKDTMLKMLVASQVKTENIDTVQKSATELIDYIVDKIGESKEDE